MIADTFLYGQSRKPVRVNTGLTSPVRSHFLVDVGCNATMPVSRVDIELGD